MLDQRPYNAAHAGELEKRCEPAAHQAAGTTLRVTKGKLLFLEGESPAGVYVLRKGSVKLSIARPEGRSLILDFAKPGEILGLSAVLSGEEHHVSAEALDACEVVFIRTQEFLADLDRDPHAALRAALQLSSYTKKLHGVIRTLADPAPVLVRLARLFASWTPTENGHEPVELEKSFTHQQIAEMLGTTRETVTRSLSEMRSRGIVTLRAGELVIHDGDRLRSLGRDSV